MIVSYYITTATNHFDRPGIKTTICKINNICIVTSTCPKYYRTQLSYTKKRLWRNLASVNLRLKK